MPSQTCCLHNCNFTQPQLKALSTGGSIIIKPTQFAENGEHAIQAMPSTSKKILKGKGFRFKVRKQEAIIDPTTGGKLDWGKMFSKAKSFVAKGAKKVYNMIPAEAKEHAKNTILRAGHEALTNAFVKSDDHMKGNKYYDSISDQQKLKLFNQMHEAGHNLAEGKMNQMHEGLQGHGIHFTKHQIKKLKVGGSIVIKPAQFAEAGQHVMHVLPDTTARIMKGKGFKYTMQKGEHIHDTTTGGKINWGDIGRSIKSGFQKVGNFLKPIAAPILHTVADMAAPMAAVAASEFGPVGSALAGKAADHVAHSAVDSFVGSGFNPARFVVESPSHHMHLGGMVARVNSGQMSPYFIDRNHSHGYNPLGKGLYASGEGLYAGGDGLY